MQRVSLLVPPLTQDGSNPLSLSGTGRLTLDAAERIFTWTDDWDFYVPQDRRQRPRPKVFFENGVVAPFPPLSTETPVNVPPVTLESEGKYTWMVTLSPAQNLTGVTPDQVPYTATVVVFYGRDFGLPDANRQTPSERVVGLGKRTTFGLGVGGGMVELSAPAERRGWLELENNQYIMLGGQAAGQPPAFIWYRVVMMGEINPSPYSSEDYIRFVNLEGPDWPSQNTRPSYAVIVTGAIGAYTIPLEREANPLWMR
jgi:hypothetical protein